MKELIAITSVFLGVLLIILFNVDPVSTHSLIKEGELNSVMLSNPPDQMVGVAGKPISDAVMKIVNKSCVHCHTDTGNKMALMYINLSNWDKYSPEKQAKKANAMCKMVTKGKMPPKSYREEHPEGVPSKEEIKTICDWAQ